MTTPTHSPIVFLARATWHNMNRKATTQEAELYQTSLLSALVSGVYEGKTTFAELRQHGDFGLGTFNALDGEMVACDGGFYQLRADGSARPVSDKQQTPFAAVTFFQPERQMTLGSMTRADLLALLSSSTAVNLFTAIRVDAVFSEMKTRTVAKQHVPYPPLPTAVDGQAVRVLENVRGSLIGFRSPQFAQGLEVAGFHLHFLSDDRTAGGHALDYSILNGLVQVQTLSSLHVELPHTQAFLDAELTSESMDRDIEQAEN